MVIASHYSAPIHYNFCPKSIELKSLSEKKDCWSIVFFTHFCESTKCVPTMHWNRETQENYNRQDPALALNVIMPKIFIYCFPLSTDKFPIFHFFYCFLLVFAFKLPFLLITFWFSLFYFSFFTFFHSLFTFLLFSFEFSLFYFLQQQQQRRFC